MSDIITMEKKQQADHEELRKAALAYHSSKPAGKIAIQITKPTETQQDLSLAYSPGVAEPVLEIASDPESAYRYTSKGNLVAVISNGSAVLGLGNVGALASKPVMEGKAVLFKRYAGVDVFDLEIDASDPVTLVDTIARIAPTFGGINLEDIKAPECFIVEQMLNERLTIPVFHDDQHGTAIVVAAGLLNALDIQSKTLKNVNIVCLGAGAAGIATMDLLVALGADRTQITMVDTAGIIHTERNDLNVYKKAFAQTTNKRTLSEAMQGADVFIGVSGAKLLSPEMLASMANNPIIFAMANPIPEIHPEIAKTVRKDLIIATGRSDMPNQINNVLCFPYIFRGALDVRANKINQQMKLAAVHAIKDLATKEVSDIVKELYKTPELKFGPNYIVPKVLDSRLLTSVAPAVAKAAVATRVAGIAYPPNYLGEK